MFTWKQSNFEKEKLYDIYVRTKMWNENGWT